jgi:hypothetical protein
MFKIPIKDQGIAFVTQQGCTLVHIPHRTEAVHLSPMKHADKATVDTLNKQLQLTGGTPPCC